MISQYTNYLRSCVTVDDMDFVRHFPMGLVALADAIRKVAEVVCDYPLPTYKPQYLPVLGGQIVYGLTEDAKGEYTLGAHVIEHRNSQITFAAVLECEGYEPILVRYLHISSRTSEPSLAGDVAARYPSGQAQLAMAVADVAAMLYTEDTSAARALAKMSSEVCRHYNDFSMYFTREGIFAMDGDKTYLGSSRRSIDPH